MSVSYCFSPQMQHLENSAGSLPPLLILVDQIRTAAPEHHGCLSGYQEDFLRKKILKAGLLPESIPVRLAQSIHPDELLPPITLAIGDGSLQALTDKKGIDKWHLSPLQTERTLVIPTFDFSRLNKQYECGLYFEMAINRCAEFIKTPWTPPKENFHLNPSLGETLEILKELETKEEVAVDIETGYGQINTVGFAWSGQDAIAINVLPERYCHRTFYEVWEAIRRVLENGGRKIFQNFIYDTSYFSAYGIDVQGEIYDTMHAMKILWPELDSNLGNVGRIYTKRPYWKDDGKIEGEEGKKKNWGDIRDWDRHYTYNNRDTTGTFEASIQQRRDLSQRSLATFYSSYIQRLIPCAREMCANGMPLDTDKKTQCQKEVQSRLEKLVFEFNQQVGKGKEVNPRSPAQVKAWLVGTGVKLIKKYDKASGGYKETSDANAIKKIRLKNDVPGLRALQEIKSLDKALSSYINFEVRPDGCLSYSLNITGTETLRWSGGKDAWGRGFNIQTIPREGGEVSIKDMFLAPDGYQFLEVDLRQAESRFVAYDSADKNLIDMLESGADVHSHVGNAILRQMGKKPEEIHKDEFKATWRQLGKKAGHGLNYGMKPRVFVETVFNELDMVITLKDATNITQAYFGLFPGIPRWHHWLRKELYERRKLSTPSGWERYFYGRPGDDMFKEGAAFRPQHTIPWITNHMMLYLCDKRKSGDIDFNLITQVHDSLILLVPEARLEDVAKVCRDYRSWHPEVVLPGGTMMIPTETKAGKRMSELIEI